MLKIIVLPCVIFCNTDLKLDILERVEEKQSKNRINIFCFEEKFCVTLKLDILFGDLWLVITKVLFGFLLKMSCQNFQDDLEA